MANTIPSPNMNMPIPVVSVDPGPDWATNVNASLGVVDQHDHSPGKGVPVTPAGLNISSSLSMGGNNLTNTGAIVFNPGAVLALLQALYVSGVDLYYTDGNGNQIQITASGSVTGATGTITGLSSPASASFSGGTFTFLTTGTVPSTLSAGPIFISRVATSPAGVTVAASSSQATNYSLTLPVALPASTSLLQVDSSGNVSTTLTPNVTSATIGPSGVPFKMIVLTGTLTASASSLIFAKANYTNLYAVIGTATYDGSGSPAGINQTVIGTSNAVYWTSTGAGVFLANTDSSNTHTYSALIIYF